jgi:NAD(P)-dependent dehydrogenase (short-subunit alcohol dehydrogenase family)
MRLAGKTALITGGNSGIGRASAILFAKEGAKVAVAARDVASGEDTVAAIKQTGGTAMFLPTDVSRSEDCRRAVERTLAEFGRIDVLFNNAGMALVKRLHETTEDEWDRILSTNLKSIYLMCRFAIPHMMAAGGGSIINTGSQLSMVAAPNFAAYCATKGAIVNLSRAMALDYAKHNIRVNTLCPGAVATPLLLRQFEGKEGPQGSLQHLADLHPMGRIGQPEELATAALFLACGEASFVTGTALVVDGGYIAW